MSYKRIGNNNVPVRILKNTSSVSTSSFDHSHMNVGQASSRLKCESDCTGVLGKIAPPFPHLFPTNYEISPAYLEGEY